MKNIPERNTEEEMNGISLRLPWAVEFLVHRFLAGLRLLTEDTGVEWPRGNPFSKWEDLEEFGSRYFILHAF